MRKKQSKGIIYVLIFIIVLLLLSEAFLLYIIKIKNEAIRTIISSKSKEGFLGKRLTYNLNETLYIEYYSTVNFSLINKKGISKKISTNDVMKEYSEENVKPNGINSNKPKPLRYYKQFLCITTNDSLNVECVRATIFW